MKIGVDIVLHTKLIGKFFLASHIAVPFLSVDRLATHKAVQALFNDHHFHVIGFKEDGKMIGYLHKDQYDTNKDISDNVLNFNIEDIISESTLLIDTLKLMETKDRLFVMSGSEIDLIITKADLQKPPIRMLFFGLITVLENEMATQIRAHHPNETWKELLTEGRLEKVRAIYNERLEKNLQIDLIDCTQFADKRTIILADETIRTSLFHSSKNYAEKWMKNAEALRDDLAHAQSLTKWFRERKVIQLVIEIETLIRKMEKLTAAREASSPTSNHNLLFGTSS